MTHADQPPVTPSGEPSPLRTSAVWHQYQPSWWCLSEVEMTLSPGELVGLVGPNGSGKTSLMRALAGTIRPTRGRVLLGERPLTQLSRIQVARRIGYLPQNVRASFVLTVEELVAQGRYPHARGLGLLGRGDVEVIRRSMEQTQTLAFARRSIDELSGGERQRAMLASVLAQEAPYLLLDEPTSMLDLQHQVDVFDHIRDLARRGLGVLVITHDLNLAASFCDRLILLFEGRIVAEGAPETVMTAETLERVYRTELIVDRNPVTGSPMVVLMGRRTGDREGN